MTAVPLPGHSKRYMVIAGLSAVLSNAILIGGDRLGLGTTAVVLMSWFATGTVAYVLHALFTFGAGLVLGSWLRFLAGAAAGIPAAWLLIQLFANICAWPMVISAPLATVVMFVYHYFNARQAITRRLFRVNRSA